MTTDNTTAPEGGLANPLEGLPRNSMGWYGIPLAGETYFLPADVAIEIVQLRQANAALRACEPKAGGDDEAEEVLHDLETWRDAYPTDIFPEPTREQLDAMRAVTAPADGVARVAAANARHLFRVRGPKIIDLITRLVRDGERMRAALKPFAKAADNWADASGDPDKEARTYIDNDACVSVAHLRDARAALQPEGAGKS